VLKALWTTPEEPGPITSDYNAAITALRKKEYVYMSWARRYWTNSQHPLLVKALAAVKDVDATVHVFNDGKITTERIEALAKKIAVLRDVARKLLKTQR
jgi:hypothetical protein